MNNIRRLIDANALDAELEKAQESLETGNDRKWGRNKGQHKGLAWARAILRDAPTIDAEPVRYADWARGPEKLDGGCAWICIGCGYSIWAGNNAVPNLRYCPNCGAKMDGGAEDEPS